MQRCSSRPWTKAKESKFQESNNALHPNLRGNTLEYRIAVSTLDPQYTVRLADSVSTNAGPVQSVHHILSFSFSSLLYVWHVVSATGCDTSRVVGIYYIDADRLVYAPGFSVHPRSDSGVWCNATRLIISSLRIGTLDYRREVTICQTVQACQCGTIIFLIKVTAAEFDSIPHSLAFRASPGQTGQRADLAWCEQMRQWMRFIQFFLDKRVDYGYAATDVDKVEFYDILRKQSVIV
ncbi:uncharacterized protein EDB91DRAFT_1081143 [Suillus paluster]|uniref:uncharacterized protein n=1 Tax=Suillus paluster TaxID=48578 RepID=UPI001B8820B7|nr:uncharacterized protein EDB91DRAFT_1081143 [Suillus paluster]KAG1743179.1 hypothetical protein EDB91DRAFT_1081143 [Suillus paluster]